MTLRLDSITRTYRKDAASINAVSSVSLSLKPGELVAVRGSSGCGKTTLLLVAGGLLQPSCGTAIVDGTDLYSLSPNARARFRAQRIGFVFQQFHLVPYLTTRDNVLAAALALKSPGAAARADELLSRFNLHGRANHLPEELSTGERQRAALARALLNEPKLVLADEPTGNLDEQNANTVLDALAAFAEQGGSVLLVTHDERASGHAHRSLTMTEGRIE